MIMPDPTPRELLNNTLAM
nr:unnamed protein product [Callosobruchus chinensis]